MAGLKEVFEDLSDSLMTGVFSDFATSVVYVDASDEISGEYDPNTGERTAPVCAYLIKNAKIKEYSDKEKARNPNILESDSQCSFLVRDLDLVNVKAKTSGLIVDKNLAIYSIENKSSNGVVYKLRIRKQQEDGSGNKYGYLFY